MSCGFPMHCAYYPMSVRACSRKLIFCLAKPLPSLSPCLPQAMRPDRSKLNPSMTTAYLLGEVIPPRSRKPQAGKFQTRFLSGEASVYRNLSDIGLPAGAALCQAESELKAAEDQETETAPSEFDTDLLESRGLSPRLAEFFKDQPRFLPGLHRVTLIINDDERGEVHARFDQDGHLCFDRALLEQAQLVIPPALQKQPEPERTPQRPMDAGAATSDGAASLSCYDYRRAFPETIIKLQPGQQQVELLVPTHALYAMDSERTQYNRGGTAGLLDYDLLTISARSPEDTSRYLYLDTLAGFNAGGWIVRSKQILNIFSGKSQFAHLYGYAQRTLADYPAVVQVGQINTASSIFPGTAITGMQIVPEYALDAQNTGAVVEGVASSPARVEVRQSGALIYSTLVPAGPFSLSALPLMNQSDLEVTVIEENGAQKHFTVPGIAFTAFSSGRK